MILPSQNIAVLPSDLNQNRSLDIGGNGPVKGSINSYWQIVFCVHFV